MRNTLVLCALALFTVSALAQQKPAAKPKAPAGQKKQAPAGMPPMPKPSPEMQKMIKAFAGQWTASVKTEAMEGMPATESQGAATFRRGPGGLSLIQEFRATGPQMGSMFGHGVTYWDPKAKNYTGIWCDSMTPSGCGPGGTSNWEGDKIVGFMEMEENGQMRKYRMTYSDIKPDSFTFTMDAPDAGGAYKTAMTIVYRRAAKK